MIYQLWGRKRVEMDERKELMERRGGNRAEGGREDEERGHESTRTHSQWLIFIKQRGRGGRGRKGEEGGREGGKVRGEMCPATGRSADILTTCDVDLT